MCIRDRKYLLLHILPMYDAKPGSYIFFEVRRAKYIESEVNTRTRDADYFYYDYCIRCLIFVIQHGSICKRNKRTHVFKCTFLSRVLYSAMQASRSMSNMGRVHCTICLFRNFLTQQYDPIM